jgi:ribosome biogenesis GTPase
MFDTERLRPLRAIGLAAPLLNRLIALAPACEPHAQPVRVTEVQRDALTVHDGRGERRARALPALLQALAADSDALAVGDWVLAADNVHGECWVQARAAPLAQLARRTRGNGDGLQRRVLVANVDTALLVMGLDGDFNLARLERYLAMARAAGVAALAVLTKADGCADAGARLAVVGRKLRPSEDAFAIDARSSKAREAFAPWLGEGRTLVLVGSSGAGKSTLTNTLLDAPLQSTGAARDYDSRGRHTTTARTLFALPGGACIVDTPGLRTLRLDVDEDDVEAAFDDIARLALRCRFRDCTHGAEPGCAVRDGVARERLANYHKLRREAKRDALTVFERRAQVSLWKARGREAAVRTKAKRA